MARKRPSLSPLSLSCAAQCRGVAPLKLFCAFTCGVVKCQAHTFVRIGSWEHEARNAGVTAYPGPPLAHRAPLRRP